jgi:abequosyltransferase
VPLYPASKVEMKLSICIPTFNRAPLLRQCLASILASIAESGESQAVEVVVSDNASSDETPSVVQEFTRSAPFLKYVRQPENIGGHLNFRAAPAEATGEFAWIIGDDDQINRTGVRRILAALRDGADAVLLNVAVYDNEMQKLIKPRFLHVMKDRTFSSPDAVLALVGMHCGYISGVVLNRRSFLGTPLDEYLEFNRDGSCFMYSAYQVLSRCRNIRLLAEPIVLNRGDVLAGLRESRAELIERDRAWNRVFAVGFPRALAALGRNGYSRAAIRKAYDHCIRDFVLPRLMLLKNERRPVMDLLFACVRYMPSAWRLWLIAIPASLMPAEVLRPLRDARKRMCGRSQ